MNFNFSPSKRNSVKIEITTYGEVNVYYPYGLPICDAKNLVSKKWEWINKKLDEINKNITENEDIFDYKNIFLLGKRVKINFERVKKPILVNETLILPSNAASNKDVLQSAVRSFIAKFAAELLPQCVSYFAEKIGKCPSKIFISQPKSIWGSCNTKKEIRLNAKLVMLPKRLLEYVVIHELCHLIELNHSENFWYNVSQYCDVNICRKELKGFNYLIGLF